MVLSLLLPALLLLFSLLLLYYVFPSDPPRKRSAVVVVLGDIARSPRMMYHAQSLIQHQFETSIVGYHDTPLPNLLESIPLHRVFITSFPKLLNRFPLPFVAPFKVFWQSAALFAALMFRLPHNPEYVFVQNPPTIPTLAIVHFFARVTGCKVILDWHNLGYSVLSLKLSPNSPLVKAARWYEGYFGRVAYAHLFVTRSMMEKLSTEWKLEGLKVIFYDRPPARFRRLAAADAHDLFVRLSPEFKSLGDFFSPETHNSHSTLFTKLEEGRISRDTLQLGVLDAPRQFRNDRPALMVSSTSWTNDEDFSILIEALSLYEIAAQRHQDQLPRILAIITGKGPLRSKYMLDIQKRQRRESWRSVRCLSMWLAAEDYPKLLGCADIGVSLHASSSGLDLPMKVVDMFGCGLPVCALEFQSIGELIKEGVNGYTFSNALDLSQRIQSILTGFPDAGELERLKGSLEKATHSTQTLREGDWHWCTWDENWNNTVLPILSKDIHSSKFY